MRTHGGRNQMKSTRMGMSTPAVRSLLARLDMMGILLPQTGLLGKTAVLKRCAALVFHDFSY
jgi:hypothetical protein